MKKTALALATAATLAFATAPVFAGESNNKAPGTQSEVLGSPGQDMAQDSGQTSFDDLDRNGDDRLDESELNAYGSTAAGGTQSDAQSGEQILEQLDEDGDGSVSREEMQMSAPVPPSEDRERGPTLN